MNMNKYNMLSKILQTLNAKRTITMDTVET
jgi:hypothetical protein